MTKWQQNVQNLVLFPQKRLGNKRAKLSQSSGLGGRWAFAPGTRPAPTMPTGRPLPEASTLFVGRLYFHINTHEDVLTTESPSRGNLRWFFSINLSITTLYLTLNGPEFEQAPGGGKGQGSLACCRVWGCKESDTT